MPGLQSTRKRAWRRSNNLKKRSIRWRRLFSLMAEPTLDILDPSSSQTKTVKKNSSDSSVICRSVEICVGNHVVGNLAHMRYSPCIIIRLEGRCFSFLSNPKIEGLSSTSSLELDSHRRAELAKQAGDVC